MTSFHSALVEFLSRLLKVAISWLPAPRPVPHSNRPSNRWSSMVTRSAHRTGWLTRGERFMMPGAHVDPLGGVGQISHDHLGGRHVAVLGKGWCSPTQAYFQLYLSASMTYAISRLNISCSHSGSWAAWPGR